MNKGLVGRATSQQRGRRLLDLERSETLPGGGSVVEHLEQFSGPQGYGAPSVAVVAAFLGQGLQFAPNEVECALVAREPTAEADLHLGKAVFDL